MIKQILRIARTLIKRMWNYQYEIVEFPEDDIYGYPQDVTYIHCEPWYAHCLSENDSLTVSLENPLYEQRTGDEVV